MRDYPSVPNVFRVASSHSIDTDPVVVVLNGGGATATKSSDIKQTNANLSSGKQPKLQQQNGNISGHQQLKQQQQQQQQLQPLAKSSSSSASITLAPVSNHVTAASSSNNTPVLGSAPSKTATTTAKPSASSSTSSTSATLLKTFAANNDSDNDLQQRQQQYKLAAHSSIERPAQFLGTTQLYLQSPYATLPRNPINISQSSLSLHTANTNGDIYNQQQQQLQRRHVPCVGHHNSLDSSATKDSATATTAATTIATSTVTTKGKKSSSNSTSSPTNEATMMGVINTISGSIPATGFSVDHNSRAMTTMAAAPGSGNLQHMSANGRTMSVASDLNASMNNSCTNLSKLNGLSQHQNQQQQQKQQQRLLQQQKMLQSTTSQQRDFRHTPGAGAVSTASNLDEFTPYRRSAVHPCASMERNNTGYLWIITPVAAR